MNPPMKQAEPSLTPRTVMADVLAMFPGAQRALFRRYHIGGCSSCAFQPSETLEELCRRNNGLDVEEVMAHLASAHEQDELLMLDPAEVDALRKAGQKIKLLDIRTREEWEAVKIEGAVRMSQETMQDILGRWSPEDLLVIYDHQGRFWPGS